MVLATEVATSLTTPTPQLTTITHKASKHSDSHSTVLVRVLVCDVAQELSSQASAGLDRPGGQMVYFC